MNRLLAVITVLVLAATAACTGDVGPTTGAQPVAEEPDEEGDLCDVSPQDCGQTCSDAPAAAVYETRIRPLLEEDRPQTCNQCHFSGLDLSLFVQGTSCEAMECLVSQELVDLDEPRSSKILDWISRAQPDDELVNQELIDAEYNGFLRWIELSAECHDSTCAGTDQSVCQDLPTPTEICDEDGCEVVDEEGDVLCADGSRGEPCPEMELSCEPDGLAFGLREWMLTWRGRCEHCHQQNSPLFEGDPPHWLEISDTIAALRTTIENLEELEAFDLEHPLQSRLLLKPLSENAGGLEHGGGTKFISRRDPSYVELVAFVEHYADCKNQNQ